MPDLEALEMQNAAPIAYNLVVLLMFAQYE